MIQLSKDKVIFHQALADHFDKMTFRSGNSLSATSPPGLTQGTSSNVKLKVANTTKCLVNFVPISFTTAEVAFTTGGVHDIPANAATVQEQVYAVLVNASGALTIVAGGITAGAGTAPIPDWPSTNLCPIGYVRIAVAAGSSPFTAGTTQPATSGAITATYTDGYPWPLFSTAQ